MLTYLEIARRLRPRWVVWENVPGVLSSNGGRDFGSFLGALGELRYRWAYRVIDAQYCRVDGRWPKAVPQRRRRVFVVGCDLERDPRGRERAAEVLALGTGLRWHLEESRKTRKAAPCNAEGGVGAGRWWDGTDCAGTLTKQNAGGGQPMPDKDNLGAVLQPIGYRWQNNRDGLQQDDAVAAMRASTGSSGFHEMNHPVVVAHAFYSTGGTHGVNQHPEVSPAVKVGSGLGIPSPPAVAFSDTSATLKGGSGERGYPDPSDGNGHSMVGTAMTVRRLTARECERLQGFPDDYTLIPWRKKQAEDCPDGPRYRALGNSMAVNCMAWIGERIAAVDAQMNERNET